MTRTLATTPATTARMETAPVPSEDYVELKKLVTAEGLLADQRGYYWMKTAVGLATLAAAVAAALVSPWTPLVLGSALFLAFASTQIALLAHDVGHRQGFRGRGMNRLARLISGNLLLGVSHSWWTTKHNQHHANPNHVDKDPDIQFPFLAFSAEQVATRPRFLRPLLTAQAFVFVSLLPLQGVLARYASIRHLLTEKAPGRGRQFALLALHGGLYAVLLVLLGSWEVALGFAVLHQGAFGLYNSSVFASNHKGMELIRDGERLDFLTAQVITSRNLTGNPLTDFWFGGLNYQIEHHLFPTMPRNNLRRAQVLVSAFCKERGIPYHTTSPATAYREGFLHLHRAGRGIGVPVRPS